MSDKQLNITIYTPDSKLLRPGELLRDMVSDLFASRELAWRLFVRNLSAQYRQSILGYLWAFLPPLFTLVVWVFLNAQNIINVDDPGMPYPIFVLVGTILWQTFVEALNTPLRVVNESRGMLTKINFPREALVIAGLGELLFNFAIRTLLFAVMFAWFQQPVTATLLLAPLGVLALITLGLMIGFLLLPLGMLYSDVGRGLVFLTQFWFFLTPVIYPMPQSWLASLLVKINPVTPLIMTTREWLTIGNASQLSQFFWVFGISLLFLLFGWVLYRIAMPHLIARMSA